MLVIFTQFCNSIASIVAELLPVVNYPFLIAEPRLQRLLSRLRCGVSGGTSVGIPASLPNIWAYGSSYASIIGSLARSGARHAFYYTSKLLHVYRNLSHTGAPRNVELSAGLSYCTTQPAQ